MQEELTFLASSTFTRCPAMSSFHVASFGLLWGISSASSVYRPTSFSWDCAACPAQAPKGAAHDAAVLARNKAQTAYLGGPFKWATYMCLVKSACEGSKTGMNYNGPRQDGNLGLLQNALTLVFFVAAAALVLRIGAFQSISAAVC